MKTRSLFTLLLGVAHGSLFFSIDGAEHRGRKKNSATLQTHEKKEKNKDSKGAKREKESRRRAEEFKASQKEKQPKSYCVTHEEDYLKGPEGKEEEVSSELVFKQPLSPRRTGNGGRLTRTRRAPAKRRFLLIPAAYADMKYLKEYLEQQESFKEQKTDADSVEII